MVDLAKTHQRKLWAKETIIAKQAERIFLSRNITAEKKEASMTILEGKQVFTFNIFIYLINTLIGYEACPGDKTETAKFQQDS